MASLEKLAGSLLKAVVLRTEPENIILKAETGQEIVWPKTNLSQELRINQEVVLELKSAEEQKKEKQEIAKILLQEILQAKTEQIMAV